MSDESNFQDALAASHLSTVEPRQLLDPARPWLEAGRSWLAAADRIAAYDAAQRGRRRRPWEKVSADERELRQRAEAARWHAPRLDRFTARGWVVWHDRFGGRSRNVVDHVLIGPGGVVVIQSVPGHDHSIVGGVRRPGIVTSRALNTSRSLLKTPILDDIHRALHVLLPPEWSVTVLGHTVLIDPSISLTFDDVLRPDEVAPFIDRAGAYWSPTDVHLMASVLEDLMPPASLAG